MPTVLLVRHGRTTANTSGVLAGWTPGIKLDETGHGQVTALAERMSGVQVQRIIASPLTRCQQTAQAVSDATGAAIETDDRLGEARYGDWTGRALADLARTRLWRAVQDHPSSVVFPGADGEAMAAVQARAVACVRETDRLVAAQAGDRAVWVAVSHGDVIKAVLADALGTHLDHFQRIAVDPGSVSVVGYTQRRPFVLRMNDTAGSLAGFAGSRRRRRGGDAAVGGGAGSS